MAGLKKTKRQRSSGSPNIALVLFLILFVLSNIILGLWLYFVYAERDDALKAATAAKKVSAADKDAMVAFQFMTDDLRLALGQQLTADEKTLHDANRKEFLDGKFKAKIDAGKADAYKNLLDVLKQDLEYDDTEGVYKTTYMNKYKDEADRAKAKDASFKAEQVKRVASEAQFKELMEKQDAFHAKAWAKLATDQTVVLNIANKQTDEMTKEIDKNRELSQALVAAENAAKKKEIGLQKQIKELKDQLVAKDAERPDGGVGRGDKEPHALLLDIARGRPLWDDPVGTITRVDAKGKEVTINLGSAKGVKPDLTFNVFAPSKFIATRAEKQLKGTIEVIRVLGPNTSVARITSLYDAEFPMNEGDLLFNLVWGTHVAITGYVNITGLPSESPGEQMRQLGDFLYMLERQGIIVDAYLDLTDGQVKGAITPNTRYLIRGEDLRVDSKDLDNKEPRAERAQLVNGAIVVMQKSAVDKGIFVISAKNFAAVTGYRAPGRDDLVYRPTIPTAGPVQPGVNVPPPMPMEKKDEKMEK